VNDSSGRRVCIWYAGVECLSPGDPDLIAAAPRMLELLRSYDTIREDPTAPTWLERQKALLAEIDGD
jgi:hypothetical protein